MLKLFEERERRISGARLEAAELQRRAHEKLLEVETRIAAAQREAKKVLAELQAEGARFHRQVLDAAKAEAHKQQATARAELAEQIDRLRGELMPLQADLSKQVINQLIGNPVKGTKMEHSHA